ncbi:helix-turn-helix domain-containing protein [Paraburkholderia sp.]|uniref:helix-turn-helix domain-containing protein n=1 Tax=Paraburkholderia sp. TaxID=1926495 RepID=UPI0023970CC3|nr:helix-turn-helix domain-containing protein [Paraburkholderia sp.]MDE1179424.1 helix-turn-helix domain-containing protein [Paraburkholderia sp.]
MDKIDSTASRQQRLNAARVQFSGGEQLPAALLSAPVARSWERSRTAGLLPSQAPQYELLDTSRHGSDSRADRRLYSCVVDEIEQLWEAFGGADWTIFCVNTQGTVVHARHSPACTDDLLLPITSGRRILESHIGTTAPSCVIHDGSEVVVARGEHYLQEFERAFCVAVPLFGFHGEVIGALDITGTGERDAAQVQEQFRLAALAAEQRMFATLRGCHLLRLQHDPRWLNTPLAGILAVEEDGFVRAASRMARRMLSLSPGAPLPALHLRQLFDAATPAQLNRMLQTGRNPQRVPRTDGSHLWVSHARAPQSRSTARREAAGLAAAVGEAAASPIVNTSTANAVANASLREQTLSAIQNAIREHEGNIAAAARQLGLSRTTLYAKLRQLRQTGMLDRDGA